MYDQHPDRMASTRRRGPQAKDLLTPLPIPQPAEVVDVPQPPLTGIRCPGCGRGMVPRRDGSNGAKCYAQCTLCGVRMVLTFSADGIPRMVRLVR